MHYELRSWRALPGDRLTFISWALLSSYAGEKQCIKNPKLPAGLKLSQREEWLKGNQDELSSFKLENKARLTVLVSGTLRGFRKCAPALRDTIITPNSPADETVQLIISTYDRNDCGGSFHTHGLGPGARAVTSTFLKAYEWNGVHAVAHMESYLRIEEIRRLYPKNVHPVFVRYHSQFFLRSRAMLTATAKHGNGGEDRIFIVLRPDARLFGRYSGNRLRLRHERIR